MTDVILAMLAVGAAWGALVYITRHTDNVVLEPALDPELVARIERINERLRAGFQAVGVSMKQAAAALSRMNEVMLAHPDGWDGDPPPRSDQQTT